LKANAKYWIDCLKLKNHPEGGYYRELYRSNEIINKKSLPLRYSSFRSFSTSIFFLLTSNEFSAFHRLKSDEIWHFYEGSPINIFIILPNGELRKFVLGNNPEKGQTFQLVIPKGCWFAAKVEENNSFTLVGCTVSPGFDFEDFEMGKFDMLSKLFPRHTKLIKNLTFI